MAPTLIPQSSMRALARLASQSSVQASRRSLSSSSSLFLGGMSFARPSPALPRRSARRPSVFRLAPTTTATSPLSSRRYLSDATRKAIDGAVGSARVVLFMKGTPELPQCGFSRAAIQILGLQGVDPSKFAAFNVLEDADLRAGIKEYSDWPTIPQLYVDGEFIGGCDILVSMHQGGDLAKLFEEKNVLVAPDAQEAQEP